MPALSLCHTPQKLAARRGAADEQIDTLNYEEQLKMIDVCALGPLRVSSAAYNQGKIATGGQVIVISSQAGSVEWRKTQNADNGGDYGHHMSRAACNIMAVLLSEELKANGMDSLHSRAL